MKIRKGDMIQITTGKDKGKTGKILRIDSAKGRVWVERLNMVKRHQRPTQLHRQGGIIEKEAPLSISNVANPAPFSARKTFTSSNTQQA